MSAPRLTAYRPLHERADRIRWSRWSRAQALCLAAGVDCAGTLHNAMIDAERGRPWRGFDVEKGRAAQELFARQFDAHRWLSDLYNRRGCNAFDWT